MIKATPTEAAVILLGNNGKDLGVKSTYSKSNPNNLFLFDAEVYVNTGRIWAGDLDITVSAKQLKKLSGYLGKKLFIMRAADKGELGLSVAVIDGDKIKLMNAFNLSHKIESGRPVLSDTSSGIDLDKKEYFIDDVKKTFKLPSVSRLKIRDGFTVLEAFYTAVAGALDENEYEKLIVSSTYAISLMGRVKKFYKEMFPTSEERDIEEMCAWEWHDLGPKNFFKDPEWVDNNTGYVLK